MNHNGLFFLKSMLLILFYYYIINIQILSDRLLLIIKCLVPRFLTNPLIGVP